MEELIFDINENTLPIIKQMAEHMPGGFFIYHADGEESFILINEAMLRLTACENEEQFRTLTKNSFKGFVHPGDIERVEGEIAHQIMHDEFEYDYVEYRICCHDGSEKWIRDYGHLVHTDIFGDVFYVFVDDATERHEKEIELQNALEEQEAQLQEITMLNQQLKAATANDSKLPGSAMLRQVYKTAGKKKKILVVEDSEINREILIEMLQDEFNILTAENGEVAINILKQQRDQISLILLYVYMPVCNGFEFLEITQKDPYLSSVPVIVATGSNKSEDEEKCLRLGATDFITKPYNLETMLGRIHNVIRLRESLSELTVIEFDRLTGLYTMSAFLHHAADLLSENDQAYDIVILSILDFASVNRIYGEKKGDEVLQYVASYLSDIPWTMMARQGNNFIALCESGRDDLISHMHSHKKDIEENGPIPNIRVREGVYRDIDKNQPVSILCDRVKLSISADNHSEEGICYYEPSMEHRVLEEKKLITAFDSSIENHDFVIWIQPKVNSLTGSIVAGEALVRWIDGEGNFISPGAFIPLFEREGQIKQLDEYIFRTVCAYQKKRKDADERMIPISINLSRNSLFRAGIVEIYKQIACEEGIELSMVPIEITESAATSEKQISAICDEFAQAGFVLQMDDFGTGYSSLSALATLPFSTIKLDKSLIDQIGVNKGNIVIKNIIETAHELGMSVVAEGVEELPQVEYLALVECDQIQGYFYSSPKKTALFEEMMRQDKPFADKGIISNANGSGIIRLSSADLNRYLKICKKVFSAVRLLEADCCGYCMANDDGTTQPLKEPCFEIWNRSERCLNCTSQRAMMTKKTEHKFEVFENEVYSVYSVYLEVDGEPHIVEMLSTVGTGLLHGYQENTSLLSLVQNDSVEMYMDVQLGTLNRRFFEERIDKLGDITALSMIDIDNFKHINDSYGHIVGDVVLKEIAATIKSMIRDNDFLIRMGGDELMLCFTGMKASRVKPKLEEIRKAVENIKIPDHEDIVPTISIGAAVCQGYSLQAHERADAALYEGKEKRNTVVVEQ